MATLQNLIAQQASALADNDFQLASDIEVEIEMGRENDSTRWGME